MVSKQKFTTASLRMRALMLSHFAIRGEPIHNDLNRSEGERPPSKVHQQLSFMRARVDALAEEMDGLLEKLSPESIARYTKIASLKTTADADLQEITGRMLLQFRDHKRRKGYLRSCAEEPVRKQNTSRRSGTACNQTDRTY
jgi:hypothetical protein